MPHRCSRTERGARHAFDEARMRLHSLSHSSKEACSLGLAATLPLLPGRRPNALPRA